MATKTTSVTLRWALSHVNKVATHGTRFKLSHQKGNVGRTYTLTATSGDGLRRKMFYAKAKEIQTALDVLEWVYLQSPETKDRYLSNLVPVSLLLAAMSVMDDVKAWQAEQFPEAHPNGIAAHLQEEAQELAANPHHIEELADVLILTYGFIVAKGYTLEQLVDAVSAKLRKNKERVWGKPDERGVVKHTVESNPEAGDEEGQETFGVTYISPSEDTGKDT